MKYLVPDTNVFVQDFRMEGNSFSVFLQNYNAVTSKIIVPKVVYQETINQFSKRLTNELNKLDVVLHDLSRLSKEIKLPEASSHTELVEAYKEHFNTKLSTANYEIRNYPNVPHEEIAQKAIGRIKPFKEGGQGYCDALIWETILEILKEEDGSEVIFVTQNSRDFFESGSLSSELKADLDKYGISKDRIRVFIYLKDVVDELLLSHLQALETLKLQINSNTIPDIDLGDWLSNKLFDLINPDDGAYVVAGVDGDECDVHLSEIYEVSSIIANEARVISSNEKYITMAVSIGLGVDICADYTQYGASTQIEAIFDNAGIGQPTPYECTYLNGQVEVDLSVIIQNDDFNNSSIEILSLSGEGGWIGYGSTKRKLA